MTTSNSATIKRVSDNFFSLLILQGINYIVPLLVFPYLVRVLGIDGFGLYSFVMAVAYYGVMLSDYGFDLSATKHISQNHDDKNKIDEIFSTVLTIKIAISVAFLMLLTLLIMIVDKFSQNSLLYIISFGYIIGESIFPAWFFQGIEKMRYMTVINAISKLIFTILIFVFVQSSEDLYLALLFNSFGALVAGSLALYIAIKRFNISLKLPTQEKIIFYLKDGWYIFTSRVAVNLYSTANVIILGLFVNNTIVGYYSIVTKIIIAIGSMFEPATRALFPYLVKVYSESKELFFKRNLELAIAVAIFMTPIAFLVNIYSSQILSLITNDNTNELPVYLLQVLSFTLYFFIYGHQFTNMLVTIGETKVLNYIVVAAGILNIILLPILIKIFGVVGVVYLNLFIVVFIAVSKGLYLWKVGRVR
jgi:PST family polysaccharide transporter